MIVETFLIGIAGDVALFGPPSPADAAAAEILYWKVWLGLALFFGALSVLFNVVAACNIRDKDQLIDSLGRDIKHLEYSERCFRNDLKALKADTPARGPGGQYIARKKPTKAKKKTAKKTKKG